MKTRLLLAGTLAGAGIFYLLDSNRRAMVRDKVMQGVDDAGNVVNRAKDMAADVRDRIEGGDLTDEVLDSLVRAELGRSVSNPSQIDVSVHDGRVVVSGPILSNEADQAVHNLEQIPGVKSVENRLRVYG